MLIWPTEINPPDPAGYKFIPVDVSSRTPMGEGFLRTRRRALTAPTSLECQWVLPSDQARLLTDFHRYALRQGADAFLMPVWVHGAFHTQTVIFQQPPDDAYFSHTHSLMTAKLSVQDELGTSLWLDLVLGDVDTSMSIATLTAAFRISRVDIFVRTPPNSSDYDVLRVGLGAGANSNCYVDDVSVAAAGHIVVVAGHASAGVGLGVLWTGDSPYTLPQTVTAKWASTGTAPTQCDILVVAKYAES